MLLEDDELDELDTKESDDQRVKNHDHTYDSDDEPETEVDFGAGPVDFTFWRRFVDEPGPVSRDKGIVKGMEIILFNDIPVIDGGLLISLWYAEEQKKKPVIQVRF